MKLAILPTRRSLFLAITLSLVALATSGGTSSFPIMPWDNAPNDLKVLSEMRDCGFTIAGFAAPQTLDACRSAGLRAIVKDQRATSLDWKQFDEVTAWTNLASLITEVGKHPAVFGYFLRDEPSANMFYGLGRASALVRDLAPGKWPYINLFPNYANREQLGTSSYTNYLDQYLAICRPPIISYDHYALMNDGSLGDGYWLNLEQIRAAALKHDIPFWNIVLSTAHYSYRVPTDADFRFQIYSTLAYGGKGISYFVYFATKWATNTSALDSNGKRTAVWYRMQSVNRQVQKLAPTLLALHSDEVYHFGQPPTGCQGPPAASLVVSINNTNFMAGDFTHRNGTRYAMIVNKDLTYSHVCVPQFRTPPRRVRCVSVQTGRLTPFINEITWLAPGAGVLLKLD
jgi:hypothetical protein